MKGDIQLRELRKEKMIRNFHELSEDGTIINPEVFDRANENQFSVVPVYGAVWEFENKKIVKKFDYPNTMELLPGNSGVLSIECGNKDSILKTQIVVYEPDGNERFRKGVPGTDPGVDIAQPHFYYTSHDSVTKQWICYFFDGIRDCKARLDLKAGTFGKIEKTRA